MPATEFSRVVLRLLAGVPMLGFGGLVLAIHLSSGLDGTWRPWVFGALPMLLGGYLVFSAMRRSGRIDARNDAGEPPNPLA